MNTVTYVVYTIVSSFIVFYVGNLCYKNGEVYLVNYFPNHLDLGIRINKLLRLAYYLLNIGLTIFFLYSLKQIISITDMIEEISRKVGFILLTIGSLHFNNIMIIYFLHKYFKN